MTEVEERVLTPEEEAIDRFLRRGGELPHVVMNDVVKEAIFAIIASSPRAQTSELRAALDTDSIIPERPLRNHRELMAGRAKQNPEYAALLDEARGIFNAVIKAGRKTPLEMLINVRALNRIPSQPRR